MARSWALRRMAKLPRESYLFNSTIMGIDEADAILLIGANPRREAAVLNARLRKAWLRDGPGLAARRARRSDVRLQVSRRRAGQLQGPQGRASGVRRAGQGEAAADHRRPGRACAGRRRGGAACGVGDWPRRRRVQGRLERLQRAAHGGRARRRPRPGLPAGEGRQGRAGIMRLRRRARSRRCCCSAWTRSIRSKLGKAKSSISAPTATPARIAPT